MRIENQPVVAADVRPARMDGTCFYCGSEVGEEHTPGCVCRKRTVVMALEVELVIDVPEHWSPDCIIDHWTQSEAGCCAAESGLCDATATGWARKNIKSLGFAREATQRDVKRLRDGVHWDGKTYSPGMVFSNTFLDKVREIANARDKWGAEREAAQGKR